MGKDNLSGKKKYTNGNISKFFYPGQEPNGWYLGCTDAYREKQSKATVENWKKDSYRDKQTKTRSTISYRSRNREANIKAWKDNYENKRKKVAEGIHNYYKNNDTHDKLSLRQKRKWKDDNYHQNQRSRLKEGKKDIYKKHPEYLVKISKGNKKAWLENHDKILEKQVETKRLRKRDHFSKIENKYYDYLLTIYDVEDVVRQYRDKRYPFNCDFYIKSEDRFIEIQGSWVHGKHPFDSKNTDDIKLLNEWKEKAKKSKYYQGAITTWTISDVNKRRIAEKNKLNIDFIY